MQDPRVKLAEEFLPNTILNNICKCNYEECQGCKTLRGSPKLIEREEKMKIIDGLTFLFVRCHFFPDKEVLEEEFNFSLNRIDCLRQIYRK